MKKIGLVILVITVVALGLLSFFQRRELRQIRNERDTVATELKATEVRTQATTAVEEKAALAEMKIRVLKDTLTQSSEEISNQLGRAAVLQGLLEEERTNSAVAKMTRLYNSPEMRKALLKQQEVYMDPMIERLYRGLIDRLHLNADQAASLKDLLKQRRMAGAEKEMSMADPDMDSSTREELSEEIKKERESYDELIRQFLGDENYKDFQSYDRTIGDRTAVDLIATQMEGNGSALDTGQRELLIQALDEERGRFKWNIDIGKLTWGNLDFSQLTDTQLEQYARDREQFNGVVLDRMRQSLSPEQLSSLEKSLMFQRQMLIYSLEMQVKRSRRN